MQRAPSARSLASFGPAGCSCSSTISRPMIPTSRASSTRSKRCAIHRTSRDCAMGVDLLMETAAHQIARAARHLLGGRVAGKWVFGLIGAGNNGADTVGALRHLENWGATSQAIVARSREERLREPLE